MIARVRQKEIKEAARKSLAQYWSIIKDIWEKSMRIENVDKKKAADYRFEMYKELVDSILQTSSKTRRNRVAGYLITLIKQVVYLQRINISELRAKYGMREASPEPEEAREEVMETEEDILEEEEIESSEEGVE